MYHGTHGSWDIYLSTKILIKYNIGHRFIDIIDSIWNYISEFHWMSIYKVIIMKNIVLLLINRLCFGKLIKIININDYPYPIYFL